MTEVTIVLAGAPMGKERIRTTKTGHVYTPTRTVTFEGRLAYAGQEAMSGRPLFEEAIEVDVTVLMPIPASKPKKWQDAARAGRIRPAKKPDWDNYGKILDALNLVVWVDDSLIVDGRVRKFYSDKPATVVRVRPANMEDYPHDIGRYTAALQAERYEAVAALAAPVDRLAPNARRGDGTLQAASGRNGPDDCQPTLDNVFA